MPLFNNQDQEIQMATLRVLSSLMTKFQAATNAEILFAWDYFMIVLKSQESPVCDLIINSV
jgi:hypothetical protein